MSMICATATSPPGTSAVSSHDDIRRRRSGVSLPRTETRSVAAMVAAMVIVATMAPT